MPVGPRSGNQELVVVMRAATGFERRVEGLVRFVPTTGDAAGE